MKRLLLLLPLLISQQAFANYTTALAKLDAVYIGEDFTPAASTAVDDEVGSNNAPLQGTGTTDDIDEAGPVAGIPYSLHFNATDHYLDLTTQASFASTCTVVFWAKRDATASDHAVTGTSGSSFVFIRLANNTTDFEYAPGATVRTVAHGVDSTAWHHYALVRDGSSNWDVYVDGSLVGDNVSSESGTFTIDWIGAKGSAASQFFDGNLAQIGFADEALTSTDIADLAGGPASTGNPDPLTPSIPGGTPDPLRGGPVP